MLPPEPMEGVGVFLASYREEVLGLVVRVEKDGYLYDEGIRLRKDDDSKMKVP